MRLNEFADAQAQLDLLRIIIDNTWSAIAQQAEQQKRVEAERKAQAKLIPKSKKSSKQPTTRIPTKASVQIKKPVDSLMKQQPPAVLKPDPNASKAVKPLPLPANPPHIQSAKDKSINPKLPNLISSSIPKKLSAASYSPVVSTDVKPFEKDEGIDIF
jgi:hypothetical protein